MAEVACHSKRVAIDSADEDASHSKLQKSTPTGSNGENTISTDLKHVFEEIPIDGKTQRLLQELGVTTIEDILKKRDDFKDSNLSAIRKGMQKNLYRFCLWHENFVKKHNVDTPLCDHFNGEAFEEFDEELDNVEIAEAVAEAAADAAALVRAEQTEECKMKKLFYHARDMLHEGNPGDLKQLSAEGREALYGYVVQLVMDDLPDTLISNCQFDVKALIETCAKAVFNLPTGAPYTRIVSQYYC